MMEAVYVMVWVGILVALVFIQRALNQLHLSLNSRLDKLLDTTRSLALKEGFTEGEAHHLSKLKQAGADLKKD